MLLALSVHVILCTSSLANHIMRYVVFLLLAAILVSLFSGLFFLSGKEHNSESLLRALKVRIALSVALVAFLVLSYFAGWIPTSG